MLISFKNTQKHPEFCLATYLGTVAHPAKLTHAINHHIHQNDDSELDKYSKDECSKMHVLSALSRGPGITTGPEAHSSATTPAQGYTLFPLADSP